MQRIGGQPVKHGAPNLRRLPELTRQAPRSHLRWLVRGSAGLLAAGLATTATLTASASALPGDVLYGLKQAQEELNLRLAGDDHSRVLVHLHRADARLDETARLLEQGRTSEAVITAQRYDQSVERATTTYVVIIDAESNLSGTERLETALSQQQHRLESLLQSAPEPARPDLREALATTERGLELMADPRPVEQALGIRQGRPASLAAPLPAPTSPAEEEPTVVPTARPTAVRPTPTVVAVLARGNDDDEPVVGRSDGPDAGRGRGQEARQANDGGPGSGRPQQRPGSSSGSDGDGLERNRSGQSADHGDDHEAVAVQPGAEASSSQRVGSGGGDGGGNGGGRSDERAPSGGNNAGSGDRDDDSDNRARSGSASGDNRARSGGNDDRGGPLNARAPTRIPTPPPEARTTSRGPAQLAPRPTGSTGATAVPPRTVTPTPTPTVRRATNDQRSGDNRSGSGDRGTDDSRGGGDGEH
jgi:hypothetical protein